MKTGKFSENQKRFAVSAFPPYCRKKVGLLPVRGIETPHSSGAHPPQTMSLLGSGPGGGTVCPSPCGQRVLRCTAVRFLSSGHQGDPWWSFVFRKENVLQPKKQHKTQAIRNVTPAINAVFASEAWRRYVNTGIERSAYLDEKEKSRLV
jgi:hypothetical protein